MSAPRARSGTMIPHIMRKDWKLLWPLALACALLQAVLAFLEYRPESFSASGGSEAAAMILSLSIGIALVLTILLVVLQDAVPGVDQDWLVRPIARRDLLIAKVLLVVLIVHGPIVAVHWLRGVAEGLAAGAMLRATLLSNLQLALSFSLPVLALAVLSRTVTEALITAIAALFFVLLSNLLLAAVAMIGTHAFQLGGSIAGTGLDWIVSDLHQIVLLLTAAAVVGLQYHRRDTRRSRIVLAAGLLLFEIVGRLPWQPAFALQEALSTERQASSAITIGLASAAAIPASGFALQPPDAKARQKPASPGQQRLRFALEVRGLAPGSVLHADHVAFRLVDTAGHAVFRGTGQDWDLRATGNGTASVLQIIDLPTIVYARSVDLRAAIELDYSLTLLTSHGLPPIPAVDGNALLPDLGRCVSRRDDDGTGFQVGCDAAGQLPPCLSVSLRQDATDQLGPESFVCDLDYEPVAWRFSVEPIERFVRKLALEDLNQGAPAGRSDAGGAGVAVVFRLYDAVAHFSRHVVVAQNSARDIATGPSPP
jgi:hypothetical protein